MFHIKIKVHESFLIGHDTSRYGYEGKEYDSVIGDIDYHVRRYNPELGMFIQPDTYIQNVYDPQSLNRYMFERGNPYTNIDPDGKAWGIYHSSGSRDALIDMGFTEDEANRAVEYVNLPDHINRFGTQQDNDQFYSEFGGKYIDYHLDPQISEERMEKIFEESARKFVEEFDAGNEKAGAYLHVFGDWSHAYSPCAGKDATLTDKFVHHFIDAVPIQKEVVKAQTKRYVGHALNLYGRVTTKNYKNRGYHNIGKGVYRK